MTQTISTLTRCLDILHAHISKRAEISRAAFDWALAGWQIEPVSAAGEVVGAVMTRANEIHIAVDPASWRKWARRSLSRQFLLPLLAQYGHIVTSVANDSPAAAFVERIGFYRTGETTEFIQYRMDHAKYQ